MQESSPEARKIRGHASALVHRPRRGGGGQAAGSEAPEVVDEEPDEALEESELELLPDEAEELEDEAVVSADRLSVR